MEFVLSIVLFLIILVVLYFIYKNDYTENSQGFWEEGKSLIIGAAVFCLLLGGCTRACNTDKTVDSGFNEWTGKPSNPFYPPI